MTLHHLPALRSPLAKILAILILALALRGFYFFAVDARQPQKFAIRDLDGYVNIAQNWLQSGSYARESTPPLTHDLSRPPVYPLLLAGLMRLGGFNGRLIVGFQILLGVASVVMTYRLARALGLGQPGARAAALLVALDPILILMGHMLLTETLYLLEWLVGLWLVVQHLRTGHRRYLALGGLVLALGALTRPVAAFLPLVLLPPLLFKNLTLRQPPVRAALLFLLLFALPLLPWMLRSQALGGGLILSNISDTNLYFYRAKAVLADATQISQAAATQRLDNELKQVEALPGSTPQATGAFMRTRALEIFRQYPMATLKMTARGAAILLLDPGYSLVCTALDPANLTPECFQGDATLLGGDLLSLMAARFASMSPLQKITLAWSTLLTALLCAGAATGVVILIHQRRHQALWILLGSILYFVALSSGAESTYRLRVPIIPLLAILSAWGLEYWIRGKRSLSQ